MCGVAASVKVGSEEKVRRAAELMSHRGLRIKGSGMVAHVRLPIVGLGEDHDQPMRAGKFVVAFVGELLDFRELDPGLECDADLVARTWVADGPAGFREHDGFWSVVAVDEDRRQLHMLCDYLAQKPLYYRLDELACASELDAAASFGPVTPDHLYLSDVCKWGYCPEPWRTPYAEVHRVLAGQYVVLDDRGNTYQKVVDPLVPAGGEDDLRAELEAAVKRRVLSSDVPVACLLSGGLDSSIVYTLAARCGSVIPYFVCSEELEGSEDEKIDAMGVVNRTYEFALWRSSLGGGDPMSKAALKVVDMPPSDHGLDHLLDVMQEPLDLGSLRPQVALSEVVAERVCLTGDGADEFFGGYGRAMRYDSQASDVFRELVCWHLPRLDRVMMRNRIEVRSPFLARRVANIALNLPYEIRRNKAVLRRVFKDDLPHRILQKAKVPLRVRTIDEAYRLSLVERFVSTRWPEGEG